MTVRLAKCLFVDVSELNYFVMFIFLVVHIVCTLQAGVLGCIFYTK